MLNPPTLAKARVMNPLNLSLENLHKDCMCQIIEVSIIDNLEFINHTHG